MMLEGVKKMAPVAAMLTFAILFFGIMIDVVCSTPWSSSFCESSMATRCGS